MAQQKTQVIAQLSNQEIELLKQAQEKYITDGNGNASIRTLLMIGINKVLTTPNK